MKKNETSSFEIYYFTGTGNSLAAARGVAGKLNGTLIPIASVIDGDRIRCEADDIVIVFPAYLAQLFGPPLIVERFVKKLDAIGSKRISAVCTCGGYESVNALPALKNLAALVRSAGGRLSAAYSLRLPMNNLDYGHIPVPIDTDREKMFRKSAVKIEDICRRMRKGKKTKYRIAKSVFYLLMKPMFRMLGKASIAPLKDKACEPRNSTLTFRELMPMTDKSIHVNDDCNGCGTCVRICPVHNIELVDGKPVWMHRCEMCFACDEWCPREAVRHWSRTDGVKYRHPDVKVSDMLMQPGKKRH